MCRSHGLVGAFGAEAWAAPERTPLYYPDAVALVPSADPSALVALVDAEAPGASVKDSFADVDLSGFGFAVLFEAQWMHRAPGAAATGTGLTWRLAKLPDLLRAWAVAWDGGEGNAELFGPGLLADRSVCVISGVAADGRVVAGAVVNRSDAVVGVSNVFGDADAAWPLVLEAVDRLFPGLPVVGYEHGDDLDAAMRHGFEPIGPLRVWMHT
jgi:hypothetical protein